MTMMAERYANPSIPFLVQSASRLFPITVLDPPLSFNAVINFISVTISLILHLALLRFNAAFYSQLICFFFEQFRDLNFNFITDERFFYDDCVDDVS